MGQDNRVEKLEAKIEILKAKLQDAQSRTYIGETQGLCCDDGELYIDYDNDKRLVMDVNQLFRDLPSIISMVTKEQKKMQEMYLEMIREAQTEI
tara:strand:- start:206 stop:487 length:282 start_codon:yes stop_codon:yes gene_type:complete